MTDSIRDLAATIAGLKEQAGRLRAAVSETKNAADDLTDRFRSMSVQGGPAARLSGCSSGHERAISQLEAIEGRLERARFIAMAAISGLRAPTTRALSGDQTDDPTTWDKPTPGTELVKSDDSKRSARSSLLRTVVRKGADVEDAAKGIGKTAKQWYTYANSDESPPEVGTSAETVAVPNSPVVRAPEPAPVDAGIALMSAMVASLVAAKGTSSAANVAKRVFRKWRST